MKIGYLLDDNLDVSDGVQQAMILIAEKMRSKGHEVHYITTDTQRTDLKNIHSVGKYVSIRFNGNSVRTPLPASSRKIKKILKEINFDVIHVQMPFSPLLAGQVIKLASSETKIIGTFHILPYGRFSIYGTKILSFLNKKSNLKINKAYAVSEPALEFMKSTSGLNGTVLPNPVDYNFFHNSKPIFKDKIISVVYVGRFNERKGVRQLAQSFNILKNTSNHNFSLTMCGKGPLFNEIVTYSQNNQLGIDFPGFVSEQNKAERLAGADVAVFPSISGESFGIVLTEAMSAGAKVTIGGDNPGYRSVLNKWPEALFDAKSPEKIAIKIEQMVNDLKLRTKIGESQHQDVLNYDIEKIATKLENDYAN